MKNIICGLIMLLTLPSMSYAEKHHADSGYDSGGGVASLSKGLRDLLSREMIAIQTGMVLIIPAYNSGNWKEIEMIAGKIERSYILKQNLTEPQIHELHSALPADFIEKDQRFHYLAEMLGHAAKNKKSELVNFYFSEMNESCLNCHTSYATHKFPALIPTKHEEEHSH